VKKGGPLYALAFSPDGARLVFGGEQRVIHEVALADGEEREIAAGQPYWITTLGYSPDGKTIVGGDESCDVWAFEAESGKRLFHSKHHVECWLTTVAFPPSGETFLFGCRPNTHAGTPAIYGANVLHEARADPDVKRLEEERARVEAECWDAWVKDGSNRELRKRVRAALAKHAGGAPEEKALDDLERSWLAGPSVLATVSPSPVVVQTIVNFASLGAAVDMDPGVAARRPEPAELAALREEAKESGAAPKLAEADRAQTAHDEKLRERAQELSEGQFLLNQWKLEKR
jgi:hypothetical protein